MFRPGLVLPRSYFVFAHFARFKRYQDLLLHGALNNAGFHAPQCCHVVKATLLLVLPRRKVAHIVHPLCNVVDGEEVLDHFVCA